ncbi:hypothetical protein EDC01DRAFT_650845 [Geopyxis carbonaria]|nr:hypothetical protein EDC01DRAFT_650845 [Geopyxis carbonaria]
MRRSTLPLFRHLRQTLSPLLRRHVHLPATPPPPLTTRLRTLYYTHFHPLLSRYGSSQRRHPWRTQICTAIIINALGDLNSQLLFTAPDAAFSPTRTLRMATTGALLAIPVNAWYTRISLAFTTLRKPAAVALRVALSQAVFSPLFLAAFFTVQGALEGMRPAQVRAKIEASLGAAWRDSLMVWPLVGAVNFALVPIEFRALVGALASLGWNTWLSHLNERAARTHSATAPEMVVGTVAVVAEV